MRGAGEIGLSIEISLAWALLNENGMIPTPQISHQDKEEKTISFWKRILEEEELRDCAPLEKFSPAAKSSPRSTASISSPPNER